jgi:hypothetical protein
MSFPSPFYSLAGAARYGKPLVLDCSEVVLNWQDLSKVAAASQFKFTSAFAARASHACAGVRCRGARPFLFVNQRVISRGPHVRTRVTMLCVCLGRGGGGGGVTYKCMTVAIQVFGSCEAGRWISVRYRVLLLNPLLFPINFPSSSPPPHLSSVLRLHSSST